MFIFKYVDVDNQEFISNKLFEYIKDQTDVMSKKLFWNKLDKDDLLKHVPEFEIEIKKIIPLEIDRIACIYKGFGHVGDIHIDSTQDQRVLWPVRNCKNSLTKFYDLNGNKTYIKYGPNRIPAIFIDEQFPMKEIAAVELTQPVVFDSSIPHNVFFMNPNNVSEPRLTVTVGFVEKNLERYIGV